MKYLTPYDLPYRAYFFLYAFNLLKSYKIFQHATIAYILFYTSTLFTHRFEMPINNYNILKYKAIINFILFPAFWHTPCSIKLYRRPEIKGQYQSIQLKKGGAQ